MCSQSDASTCLSRTRLSSGVFSRTLFVAAAAMASTACGPTGWRAFDTQDSRTMRSVYVSQKDRATAVGEEDRITYFDGDNAAEVKIGADLEIEAGTLYAIQTVDGQDVMVGDAGLVLTRGEDGVFAKEDSRTTERLFSLILAGASTFYAGGDSGRVIRRTLEQSRWETVDVHAPQAVRITGAWAADEAHIAFVTSAGSVIERVGNDWVTQSISDDAETDPLPLFGVWSSGPDEDMFVVGLGGAIYRRQSGDDQWTLEAVPTTQDLYAIFGTAPDRIFAVGARGTILRYDGLAWKADGSPVSEDLFSVHGTSDGKQTVAVGSRGLMAILDE